MQNIRIMHANGMVVTSVLFLTVAWAGCSHMVDGCFPGCTLLLVLLEEGAGVDTLGATATRYLVTPTPEAGRLSPAALVELRDVPSVQGVLRSKQVLAANMINPKGSG